jgi:formylglycine-generating enzyme required for sulfatase activity
MRRRAWLVGIPSIILIIHRPAIVQVPMAASYPFRNSKLRRRSGFSRTEMLIVLLLAVVGISLAIPLLMTSRENARRVLCQSRCGQLVRALEQYHETHTSLPPAAIWSTHVGRSIDLHKSRQIDRITLANWAVLILPHLGENKLSGGFDISEPIGSLRNAGRTRLLSKMSCPTDSYNNLQNLYEFQPLREKDKEIGFARGNYAINGGTHNFQLEPPSTTNPRGDFGHLETDDAARTYRRFGNGIAGINKSFSLTEFRNSRSTLVAIEELRAGVNKSDPRGVWALGQIGGSITWAHGVNGDDCGPNNQFPRSDDIFGCAKIHESVGEGGLQRLRMPCVHYVDQNQQATSRSLHADGVFCGFLDGGVKFVSDRVDRSLWHVMHSRETPASVLSDVSIEASAGSDISVGRKSADLFLPNSGLDKMTPPGEAVESFTNSIGMKFVQIPGGTFQMGIPDLNHPPEIPQEVPSHLVHISQPIRIGICEVTFGQLESVGMEIERLQEYTEDFPAVGITWDEAVRFCSLLSKRAEESDARRSYRLPTEAEWEYACREGRSEPYAWTISRQESDNSGNAAGIVPDLKLQPVGSYPANQFGLFDMRGNAWEWTKDWFERDYYGKSPTIDPSGPGSGFLKVVRGCDWRFTGEICHIDYAVMPPWKSNPFVGFRVVCEIELLESPSNHK